MIRRLASGSRLYFALAVSLLAAGCAGIKTYPNDLPKNVYVTSSIDSGSAVRSTVAEFDIHRVNAKCETDNLGRVYLDKPKVEVGMPVGELLYLDFIFASKAFLATKVSAVRHTTLLKLRPGHDYRVHVEYDKGVYDVVIREVRRGSSSGRVIERIPFSSCTPK